MHSRNDILLCPTCGSQIAPHLRSCPGCQSLVHTARLKALAAEAERLRQAGDTSAALTAWRTALELLPTDSRQYQTILAEVTALSQHIDGGETATARVSTPEPAGTPQQSRWVTRLGALSTAAFLLWKCKLVLVFLLAKAKLLVFGLTKATTFFSMLLSLGVYWTQWGWQFALGLVVSIYIHEMGHVATLQRFGIAATAPMFIPGVGALVRLRQYPTTPQEDARVGLAGPLWGLGAILAAYLVFLATGWASWAAIARVGAWINLFNLLPVWQLDGSRGFRALSRGQRWLVVLALALLWYITWEGLLVLLALVAGMRACAADAATTPDRRTLLHYIGLAVAFAWLCTVHVPLHP